MVETPKTRFEILKLLINLCIYTYTYPFQFYYSHYIYPLANEILLTQLKSRPSVNHQRSFVCSKFVHFIPTSKTLSFFLRARWMYKNLSTHVWKIIEHGSTGSAVFFFVVFVIVGKSTGFFFNREKPKTRLVQSVWLVAANWTPNFQTSGLNIKLFCLNKPRNTTFFKNLMKRDLIFKPIK